MDAHNPSYRTAEQRAQDTRDATLIERLRVIIKEEVAAEVKRALAPKT